MNYSVLHLLNYYYYCILLLWWCLNLNHTHTHSWVTREVLRKFIGRTEAKVSDENKGIKVVFGVVCCFLACCL